MIVLFGSERPTEVVHVLLNKTAWYHLHRGHTDGDRSALGETSDKIAIEYNLLVAARQRGVFYIWIVC